MRCFFNFFSLHCWQVFFLFLLVPDAGFTLPIGKSPLVQDIETIIYNPSFAVIPNRTFSANDYGAVGDGTTLNTRFIQSALDAASEAGGGIVSFLPGIYVTGAIFVRSNIELKINKGVIILAVQDDSGYPRLPTRIAGIETDWLAALINVYEEENVRITGHGVIDGNGEYWWRKFWGEDQQGGMMGEYKKRGIRWAVDYDCERVRPIVIWKSTNVLLKDVTIKRAGFWNVSLIYSDKVHVDGLVIRSNTGLGLSGVGPSSDGINTDSSRNILVENCDIDCNDDNLCVKSGRDADGLRVGRPAERIVYRDCITRSGHGLFTLGSETSGGIRDIEVYNLVAKGTSTGIRFKSAKVRGGLIENIRFHHIQMENVKNPFRFDLNWFPEYSYPKIPDDIPQEEITDRWRLLTQKVEPPEIGIPEFRNIFISDITVKNSIVGIFCIAFEEKFIHNVMWENVIIEAQKPGKLVYARDWMMKNVILRTPDGKNIEAEHCIGVELPVVQSLDNASNPVNLP